MVSNVARSALLILLAVLTLGAPSQAQTGGAPSKTAAAPPHGAHTLDQLYARLAQARDPDEAQGIAGAIDRAQMQSGSPTADLLMSRALAAIDKSDHPTALALLDKVVALEPQWVEAWNKRATVRFLDRDDAGSVNDISHVLSLEPRHFGALSGLGFILERNNLEKRALQAFRRTLEIYPALENIRKLADKLAPEIEGRGI